MSDYYLAVDIGASSGRHILGYLANGKLRIEEIYRFENGMDRRDGHLYWDVERLSADVGIPAKNERIKEEDLDNLVRDALADACAPGNPRDAVAEDVLAMFKQLM